MRNFLLGLSCFWGALLITSCNQSYLPGFDFASFEETPVEDLAEAVENDDPEDVTAFVVQNANLIDYQDSEFGHTLLFLAVVNHKFSAAKALLDHGADLSVKSFSDSSNVLMTLCSGYSDETCDTAMLSLLLHYNPDLNSYRYDSQGNQISILFESSQRALVCLSFIKMLVRNGADVNYWPQNRAELSPVAAALLVNRLDIVRYYLIDCKAEVPSYVTLRPEREGVNTPISITQMLNEQDYSRDPAQQRIKGEILTYLSSIGKE
jgi:ankyrin repeat protein